MVRRGDIYLVSLEPVVGHEQAGLRPVVVISPHTFNMSSGVPIVLPVTTGGAFARNRGFAVPLPQGLRTSGYILCNQPRALDLAARSARFRETIAETTVSDATERLLALLGA